MTAYASATKRLSLQVYDQSGQSHAILLEVEESAAKGQLTITPQDGQRAQEYSLTQIRKSHDGKTLTCHAGAATATLTIDDGAVPSALRLVARILIPVLDSTFTLSEADQQRLISWIKTLTIETLS